MPSTIGCKQYILGTNIAATKTKKDFGYDYLVILIVANRNANRISNDA